MKRLAVYGSLMLGAIILIWLGAIFGVSAKTSHNETMLLRRYIANVVAISALAKEENALVLDGYLTYFLSEYQKRSTDVERLEFLLTFDFLENATRDL